MKRILTIALLLSTSVASADEAELIKMSKSQENQISGYDYRMINNVYHNVPVYRTVNYLELVVNTDNITVKSIVINRGNCSADLGQLPANLKFGDRFNIPLPCNPIEVKIETDQGELVNTWDD